MKASVIVFCGEDGNYAKTYANRLRDKNTAVMISDASLFDGCAEPCDRVVIMPDVFPWRRDKIEEAYPGKVEFVQGEDDHAQVLMNEPAQFPATNFHTEFQRAMEVKRPRGRPRKAATQ